MKTLLVITPIFPTQFKAAVNAFADTHRIVAACHKTSMHQIRNQENLILIHELPFGGFENNLVVFGNAVMQLMKMMKEKQMKPDLVLVQASFGFEMLLGLIGNDVPVIGYFETWYPDRFIDPLSTRDARQTISALHTNELQACLAQRCSLMITPSKYQRSQFPPNIRKKMLVLHEGVDTEFFCPTTDTPEKDFKLVTFVSTGLEPGKGFMQFIEVMKIVMQQRNDVKLEIVGSDNILYNMYDDAYPEVRNYREDAITLLGPDLMKRVIFRGSVDRNQVLDVYQRSDLHVHFTTINPSWSLLEAMSCGCVVLASSNGGILDEFTGGDTEKRCFVTNHDDFPATSELITNILNNPDLDDVKAAARNFVQSELSPSEDTWKTLIKSLL